MNDPRNTTVPINDNPFSVTPLLDIEDDDWPDYDEDDDWPDYDDIDDWTVFDDEDDEDESGDIKW